MDRPLTTSNVMMLGEVWDAWDVPLSVFEEKSLKELKRGCDGTLSAPGNMLQISSEDATDEHRCTFHMLTTDADGSLSDPWLPSSQDNETWLVPCEFVISLPTTAIADKVGTEVQNRETSSVVNHPSTPVVLCTVVI